MLDGKVAIITGSSGALGSAATKLFLENGAKIVALYHTKKKFNKLKENLGKLKVNLTGIQGDATQIEDCNRLINKALETQGRLDILINIVGGWGGGKTIDETSEETWDKMMDLNAKTVFLCSRAALKPMLEQNYGKIVSISAKSSLPGGRMRKSGVYAVSKGAVRILTQAMAEEVKNKNINVNCIILSTIDTEANRKMMPNANPEKWVKPEYIAQSILFLCSDNAKDIKGACIPVYGNS
jgi:NAD(P)-dependent dehydrogenase (short-subunit alcohol dehydrogenase family)